MAAAWLVSVAATDPAPPRFWDPRLLATVLALIGVILLGALFLYWIDRWRKKSTLPTLTANQQLANFRELYEQGEISQREFERIKARLAPLLREELHVPEVKIDNEPAPKAPATDAPPGTVTPDKGADQGGNQEPPIPTG